MDRCPLCKSGNLTEINNKLRNSSDYHPLICKDCGLTFLDKLFYTDQNDIDNFYRKEYMDNYYIGKKSNIIHNFNDKLPYQKIRKARVKKYFGYDTRVLDIGCGPGYFLDSIKMDVLSVVGIEKNNDERKFVNHNLKITCYEDMSDDIGLFDLMVLNQVLEHVYNPVDFLKKIALNLDSNGVIVIEVPTLKNPLVSFYKNNDFRNFWFQEPHLWYFDKHSLITIIESAFGVGCIEEINIYQETSFTNHYDWVQFGQKSPSREYATSDLFPLRNNNNMLDELDVLFKEFNKNYKLLLEQHGYGDTMLAVVRIK